MSLQYIIDGYNVIRHPSFSYSKKIKDERLALVEFIKIRRPCGSLRNKITIVFDGNPDITQGKSKNGFVNIIFTKKETADEWIKRIVESEENPKNIAVVSDDKEIRFFVKSLGARSVGVEEFIDSKERLRNRQKNDIDSSIIKPELTYSQIQKINQELKKIWLR